MNLKIKKCLTKSITILLAIGTLFTTSASQIFAGNSSGSQQTSEKLKQQLFYKVAEGQYNKIKRLLDNHKTLPLNNIRDSDGNTLLHECAHCGRLALINNTDSNIVSKPFRNDECYVNICELLINRALMLMLKIKRVTRLFTTPLTYLPLKYANY